jgi:hypothetical protein
LDTVLPNAGCHSGPVEIRPVMFVALPMITG